MAGSLFHAPRFEKNWYTSSDGNTHYELVPLDGGDIETISVSSWYELMDYFESVGVPRHVWPVYGDSIDLPFDDILKRNKEVREHTSGMVLTSTCPEWVDFVLCRIHSGEVVFFCT
jgi:hypothetical protein